jgi:hypothetical protein
VSRNKSANFSRARCSSGDGTKGAKQMRSPDTTARFRFAAKIVHGAADKLGQPQHASVDGAQEAHPNVEDLRPYLEEIVERAKDETLLRQSLSVRKMSFPAITRAASFGR